MKILDKAKELAISNEEKNLAYQVVELEKSLNHNTLQEALAAVDELSIQAKNLSYLNVIASKFSNLSLQLYSIILKTGHVKIKPNSKLKHIFMLGFRNIKYKN